MDLNINLIPNRKKNFNLWPRCYATNIRCQYFFSTPDPDFDNKCLFSDVRDRNGIWKAKKKIPSFLEKVPSFLDKLLNFKSQYRMNGSYKPEGKYDTSPNEKYKRV